MDGFEESVTDIEVLQGYMNDQDPSKLHQCILHTDLNKWESVQKELINTKNITILEKLKTFPLYGNAFNLFLN